MAKTILPHGAIGYIVIEDPESDEMQKRIDEKIRHIEVDVKGIEAEFEIIKRSLEQIRASSSTELNTIFNKLREIESAQTSIDSKLELNLSERDDQKELINNLFEKLRTQDSDTIFKSYIKRPSEELISLRDNIKDFLKRFSDHDDLNGIFTYIDKGVTKALSAMGFEEIKDESRVFNEEIHEVLDVEETNDSVRDGVIVQVMRCGYRHKDKMFRPIGVQVFRYSIRPIHGSNLVQAKGADFDEKPKTNYRDRPWDDPNSYI